MFRLSQFNPTRRLVGRLFLWFWATFIVTAVVAAWMGRMLVDDVEIGTPNAGQQAILERAATGLQRNQHRDLPLQEIVKRLDRHLRHRVFAVNLQTGEVMHGGGPPPFPRELEDIRKTAGQVSPITLKRGGSTLLGPLPFAYRDVPHALFVGMFSRPQRPENALLYLLGLALVITIALSYWFAKSLVRPILQLQASSQQLARGDWQVRVRGADKRQDEIGQLARDFNSMASQLERLWRGQKRLLADISHELRSPLARLHMAVGLAHQQQVEAGVLTRIEREAERMEALINQLLQLARAESGEPEMEPIVLPELLEELLADAHFEATNSHKHIEIGAVPAQSVTVNKELLCSAVENVLRNAIRYASSAVHMALSVGQKQWNVTITDDGPGLSEQECQTIFDPFYRASLARDRESGGVGLGLAIAKAAVELHHGRIHATPLDTGGLKVVLTFPLDGRTPWSGDSPQSNS